MELLAPTAQAAGLHAARLTKLTAPRFCFDQARSRRCLRPALTVDRGLIHSPLVTTPLEQTRSPFAGSYTPDVAVERPSARIHTVDVTRGVAMILMAIDHVRVYAGVPPGGPVPGVFFTRWITNFVAPAFAFLSGTSAYILRQNPGR